MDINVLTDEPYLFSGLYERSRHAATGVAGGHAGKTGKLSCKPETDLKPKVTPSLPAETIIALELPGGGYGPPLERKPERVLDDVRNGYVSPEDALETYGVVMDTKTWTIDESATAERRSKLLEFS